MEAPLIGIVDDDESVRDSISSLVRSAGFRATVYASGEAFLESDQTQAVCLILDVRMPRSSGLDLQRRLLEMKRAIPIIFITAHPDDEVRKKALEHGAVAFLRKPFAGEALLDAVRSALK